MENNLGNILDQSPARGTQQDKCSRMEFSSCNNKRGNILDCSPAHRTQPEECTRLILGLYTERK